MSGQSREAASAKPAKGAKSRATQQQIIEAFERVLLREGAAGVGVNAIVAEAGVGKGLIYHHFGGLEGLAQAWLERADLNPTKEEIAGAPEAEYGELSTAEKLSRIHVNYASMLRDKPAACQILAQDLTTEANLPEVLESVRTHLGESHEALLMENPEFHNDEAMARAFVLQAAANYLAMRANTSPNYNGIQLDTEEGWGQMMAMFDIIAQAGSHKQE